VHWIFSVHEGVSPNIPQYINDIFEELDTDLMDKEKIKLKGEDDEVDYLDDNINGDDYDEVLEKLDVTGIEPRAGFHNVKDDDYIDIGTYIHTYIPLRLFPFGVPNVQQLFPTVGRCKPSST